MVDATPPSDADLDALAVQFRRFAETECGESPLYRHLALLVATDRDLLTLATHGEHRPKANLLLAAVHDLLLSGASHPLAAFYPSVSPDPRPPAESGPAFRDFCLRHAAAIRERLATRRVQTNEVARCALLVPAFAYLVERTGAASLALVEVGTSAGLLLHWDRYTYQYGDGRRIGADSALTLHCEPRGDLLPPLPTALPAVSSRTGLDLHIIDVRDPEQARWLDALVWPDQPERATRLHEATAIARAHPLTLREGDARTLLPDVLAAATEEGYLCVFHAHVLNQFRPDDRQRYADLLAAHSHRREVCDLSLEALRGVPRIDLRRYRAGELIKATTLATYDPHGRWIEWLASQ